MGESVCSIYLIGVAREGLDGLFRSEPTTVNGHVRGTGSERGIGLPVDVEGGRRMEGELLCALARRRVPDDRRLTYSRAVNSLR